MTVAQSDEDTSTVCHPTDHLSCFHANQATRTVVYNNQFTNVTFDTTVTKFITNQTEECTYNFLFYSFVWARKQIVSGC